MKKLLPTNYQLRTNNSSGFTLIELLVVIAIIAILSVLGAVIFSGVQQRARDSRRQTDITAIAKALEANKITGSAAYPQIASNWFAGGNVPAESVGYTPQYSIVFSTTQGTTATAPTVWDATSTNPTAPSCCTGNSTTVASGVPSVGSLISFQVCALLETGTAPNIFCVPNSQ